MIRIKYLSLCLRLHELFVGSQFVTRNEFKQLFISFLFDSSVFILRPQSTWSAWVSFLYAHFFLLRQQKDKSFSLVLYYCVSLVLSNKPTNVINLTAFLCVSGTISSDSYLSLRPTSTAQFRLFLYLRHIRLFAHIYIYIYTRLTHRIKTILTCEAQLTS